MRKLLALSVLSLGLAAGGALAQTPGASGSGDRPSPGETRSTSPADGVMSTLDRFENRGGAFFTDDSRAELRSDEEINSAYQGLREEQRSELDTACASLAEGLGGDLCNKIKR